MTTLLLSVTAALTVAWLIAWLPPARAHGLRRRLLLAGLVVPVALPLARWLLEAMHLTVDVEVLSTGAGESNPGSAAGGGIHALALVGVAWALGTLLYLTRMVVQWTRLSRVVRQAQPLTGEQRRVVQRLLTQGRESLPEIRVSGLVGTACVALQGLRPVILLPEEAASWGPRTLRAVLSHECEHLRRGDAWWRLAGEAIAALWWWHPLVHAVLRRWTEACELVCDEAVLRSGVRPRSYARALLALASAGSLRPVPGMAFIGRPASRLRRRVASILSDSGAVSKSWLTWAAVTLLVLALLLAATLRFHGTDGDGTPLGMKTSQETEAAVLQSEAKLRLEANPFPADGS